MSDREKRIETNQSYLRRENPVQGDSHLSSLQIYSPIEQILLPVPPGKQPYTQTEYKPEPEGNKPTAQ